MAFEDGPFLTGKTRELVATYTTTLTRSVAFYSSTTDIIRSYNMASAGGSTFNSDVALDLRFDQFYPGTIDLGYSIGTTFYPLSTIAKPAGSITYDSAPGDATYIYPYEIITWSATINVIRYATVRETLGSSGTGIFVGEAVPLGQVITTEIYVNGTLIDVRTTTPNNATALPDDGASFYTNVTGGMSATTEIPNVPLYVNSSNVVIFGYISDLAVSCGTNLAITIPHNPPLPGITFPENEAGSASATTLFLSAPTLAHKGSSGSVSLSLWGLESASANGILRDLEGAATTEGEDVYVNCGGQQFKLANVSGAFTFSQQLGGAAVSCGITRGTETWSASGDTRPVGPTGARLNSRAWPQLLLSKNPAGFTGTVATEAAFDVLLPFKAGGLSFSLQASRFLHGSTGPAWALRNNAATPPVVGFFLDGNGSVSLTGSGAYLRLTATTGQSSARITPSCPYFPYRYVKIRCRSVGSANRTLRFRTDTTSGTNTLAIDFTTGADGEWVERDLDLMLGRIVGAPTGAPTRYSEARLFAKMDYLEFFAVVAGVYEFEFIKGEAKGEPVFTCLRPPLLSSTTGGNGHGLPDLLGIVDGWVGMAFAANAAAGTVGDVAARINSSANLYPAWTATLTQARRFNKYADTFPIFGVGDMTDEDAFAAGLGAGGVYADGSPAWSSGALPVQPVGSTFNAYPGFGGFDDGAEGTSNALWQAIPRSEAVAIAAKGDGSGMSSGLIVAGAAGSATTDSKGLARVGTPGFPPTANVSSRLTGNGAKTAFWTGVNADSRIINPTAANWDYYDYRTTVRVGRNRVFLLFLFSQNVGWLSADVSPTLRVVRSQTVEGKIELGFLSAPPPAPILETAWEKRTPTITGTRSCARWSKASADSGIVLVYEEAGGTIQRVRTTNEGQSFTVAATVFTTGYFPTVAITPTGVEHHFSLANASGGAIQGKVLDATGNVILATFTAVTTGAAADALAAWERAGVIYLAYRKSSDGSVAVLRSTDGTTFF